MNQIALDFIRQHEGCKLTAYQDSAGVWTAGWGATGADVKEGVCWSQSEADARLAKDVQLTEHELKNLLITRVIPPLSEQQMAALISFAFNLGIGALSKSDLLRCVKDKNYMAAALQFARWRWAGNKEIKGLLIRRFEEAALFLKGSP